MTNQIEIKYQREFFPSLLDRIDTFVQQNHQEKYTLLCSQHSNLKKLGQE